MKKITCIIVGFFVLFVLNGSATAKWYGNHGLGFTYPNLTECNDDGDTYGGVGLNGKDHAVANNNSTSLLVPHSGSMAVGVTGTMRCLYWDAATPSGAVSYPNGVRTAATNISISANDKGGSTLQEVRLQVSSATVSSGGSVGAFGSWTDLKIYPGIFNSNFSATYSQQVIQGKAFKYRLHVRDLAQNINYINSSSVLKFQPLAARITRLEYSSGWKPAAVPVVISDNGGSGIISSISLQRQSGTVTPEGATTWSGTWTQVYTRGSNFSNYTYNQTVNNGYAFKFRFVVSEVGGTQRILTGHEIIRFDSVTPKKPIITAVDGRPSNQLRPEGANLIATIDRTNVFSHRYNLFCLDQSNICTPNNATQPDTRNLSTGTYYFKAKTCNQAGLCSGNSVFILKIDTSLRRDTKLTYSSGLELGWQFSSIDVFAQDNGFNLTPISLELMQGNITSTAGNVTWVGGWKPVYTSPTGIKLSNFNYTHPQSAINRKAYKYRFKVVDSEGGIAILTGQGGSTKPLLFDTTTPSKPTVVALDGRTSNIWRTTSTNLRITTDTTNQVSKRTTKYCIPASGVTNCTPNVPLSTTTATHTINTQSLGNGVYPVKFQTCTQAKDSSGNLRCSPIQTFILKIDNTTPLDPVISGTPSTDTWTNNPTAVLTSTIDRVGEVSTRSNYYCMVKHPTTTCNPNNPSPPNTVNLTDGVYYYKVKTCTQATEPSGQLRCSGTETHIIKIDTTAPVASDVGNSSPGNNSNLLATTNQNITFPVSDGATAAVPTSPIVKVEYYFEKTGTPNSYNFYPINNPVKPVTISRNYDVSKVDNNRLTSGQRNYKMNVTKLCDQAGNCVCHNTGTCSNKVSTPYVKLFTYKVFANITSIGKKEVVVSDRNNFTGGASGNSPKVADGTEYKLGLQLEDIYGNGIIPASSIGRTIDFTLNSKSNLHLNQYSTGSSTSAVFIKDSKRVGVSNYAVSPLTTIGSSGNNAYNDQKPPYMTTAASSNDKYYFNYKVYTPTYQNDWVNPNEKFIINSIKLNIKDTAFGNQLNKTLGNIPTGGIDFNFKALYNTEIIDDIADQGFIEGGQQNSKTIVSKESSTVNPAAKKIYMKFGGDEVLFLNLKITNIGQNVGEGSTLTTIYQGDSGFEATHSLDTLLTQSSTISNLGNHYLSSHVSYLIDNPAGAGKIPVLYNSSIVGKTYYGNPNYSSGGGTGGNTRQSGIKIIGKAYSKRQTNIVLGQGADLNLINAQIGGAELRGIVQKNSFKNIKSLDVPVGGNKKLKDIIVYRLNGGTIKYSTIDSNYKQSGKTIVILGGDLIIDNTRIEPSGGGIMGIVILKNDDKGGNLLITDDVLYMEAAFYIDKAVHPYSLSGVTGAPRILTIADSITNFENQLYIKGTFFQNNTIGGSRSTPFECPYYVNESSCDLVKAQQYDLNYLRRFYVYDSDVDGTIDSVAGSGKYSDGSSTYDATKYYNPVIIEYNSKIQTTPPPLFSESR